MRKEYDVKDSLNFETKISKTRIRLYDRRGEVHLETIVYHPGEQYPQSYLQKICEGYGYGLDFCRTEDTVSGVVDWREIFDNFATKRNENDRPFI